MSQLKGLPWVEIHNFLLNSGNIRDPKELSIEVVKKIHPLIPYDQARIYFMDDNGKLCDEVLFGADKHWSNVYIEYFSQLEDGRYNLFASRQGSQTIKGFHDWSLSGQDEFVTDYIRPQGLRYSVGFELHDANNSKKCVCAFDRTKRSCYTENEMLVMNVIKAHVENLHRNLFVSPAGNNIKRPSEAALSRRESEISKLLCDGITPANIGKRLCLSVSTVYRHIANIHSKLGVSNRQELIVRFLKQSNNSNIS